MLNKCLTTHLLFLLLLNLGALNVHLGSAVGCHEAEREALLMFKQNLAYNNNILPSWKGKDCCNWEGVGCDNVTAYVNRLDLHNPYCQSNSYGDAESEFIIAPKLDSFLVELKYLNYLDLSCNDFLGSIQIPVFIGSFKYLRYLNLSYCNFNGVVPSQLGNLTRLENLDLSINTYQCNYGYCLSSDLDWVSKLVSLQYLNMGGINISQSRNFVHLTMPPPLTSLWLSNCGLGVPQLFSIFSNSTWFSRIQQLDLSQNNLESPLLRVFANMTSLTYLDLSGNKFNGSIPRVFANMTSLTYLDLSLNNFNGSIPLSMRNMRKLEYLDLHNNPFSSVDGGAVMGILGNLCKLKTFDLSHVTIGGSVGANKNLSKCLTYDLETLQLGSTKIGGTLPNWLGDFKNMRHLDMSGNRVYGHIPISIGSLQYLEDLDLSSNNFTGSLPESLGNLRKLRDLQIKGNRISGQIPEGLGKCEAIEKIDLSSNFLQGVVSESHLSNLTSLEYIDLSFNSLYLNFSSEWSPPFQLREFHMRSCKTPSQFPQWLQTQANLSVVDLSDNMMSGELIDCFPSVMLSELNVSHNQITGLIPHFSSTNISSIDLSYNYISGPLIHPSGQKVGYSFCNSSYLGILFLQKNNLSGSIPDCLGELSQMTIINLSYNQLSGNIPLSLGLLSGLVVLKLNNNALEGHIPPTLNNCTSLALLDISENKLFGKIPSFVVGFTELVVLNLRANKFEGVIPPELCLFTYLHILDLADNKLMGDIPQCLGYILGMRSPCFDVGNLKHIDDNVMVVLKGEELEYSTTLGLVVSLDLSCNDLTGSIPIELTKLTGLIGLNLSHNQMSGIIPENIGDMGSLESLDLSNNNISGTIPSSLSAITSLTGLNLSYNNLHGQIPTGSQLQTLNDPSAYKDNLGLCGDPLPNKCKSGHGENQLQEEQERDNKDIWEKPLFYFVIFSGFATGFWGVVGSLILKRRFRWALFQLLGNITDYLFVQVMIRFNKLRN